MTFLSRYVYFHCARQTPMVCIRRLVLWAVALGRTWIPLRAGKTRSRKMLPNLRHPVRAVLGGDVGDESPNYAQRTNSRLNPIDFYAQQINFMKIHNSLRATQNPFHLPAPRQFIHQFIQIPNLLCQGILDFLHTSPTDHSGNEFCIGV